ncbi:MAG: hypothetical protein WC718_14935 [Phycisphaerales bacterium]|jgi:hypothetical protein
MIALVRRLLEHPDDAEALNMAAGLDERQQRNLLALTVYEARYRQRYRGSRRMAQRRALRLLRTLLSAEQRRMLASTRYFYAEGSAGGLYRLIPGTAYVHRVDRHGKRRYADTGFCIHGPEDGSPQADETIGQLLLLTTDEPGFLATANARHLGRMLWDGGWRRQLNAARREREQQGQVA